MKEAHHYYAKIRGEKCYLSPINPDDAELYTRWLNDLDVARYLTLASQNISLPSEKECLEKLSREHNYAIIDASRNTLIGNCGLMDIDNLHHTAEIGIFLGDRSYWGKGFGSEALMLLLWYAFSYLNLRNIMLRVFSFNTRGLSSYKKCGFREIGRRRNALRREGAEHDIIFMDILNEDFTYTPPHLPEQKEKEQ